MRIIKLDAIASTNSYVKEHRTKEFLDKEVVVVTTNQTSGRGQRDTFWESEAGKNLTFSVFKVFGALEVSHHFYLNMAISLAITDVLNSLQIPNVSIKWPNDILAGNRKICGLLIENTIQLSYIQHSVIGVGLNVNQEKFDKAPQATTMFLETNTTYDLDVLLQRLLKAIQTRIYALEYRRFSDLKEDYLNLLYGKQSWLWFEDARHIIFEAKVLDVKKDGHLLLLKKNGDQHMYAFKEIKWRLDRI